MTGTPGLEWKRERSDLLREEVYSARFPSGFRLRFLPKPGFRKKTAALGIRYGSIDGVFTPPGRKDPVSAFPGLAHFLEHRVFQREEKDAFDLFSALGASSNAATSYTNTTYYFSTVENFPDCLRLLLGFLDGLHVTKDAVEKEKDIIAEEIRGNQDHPGWLIYHRLMACLYVESHARFDILGTLDDIAGIDEGLLHTAYDAFYHPGNADLAVSGDLDPDGLLEEVARSDGLFASRPPLRRGPLGDPPRVASPDSRVAMKVSQPKVLLGFKERDPDVSGTPLLRRQMETSIAMAAAFGRASDFYQRFYAEGLIDDSFYGTYSADPGLAFSLFSADTDAPEAFVDRVLERIETVRRRGIDEADFLRILRRIRGRFLRNFNHPETVAFSLLSHSLRDSSLFSVLDVLQELDTGGVDRRMGEHFDTALSARSILVPAEAGGQAHHQP